MRHASPCHKNRRVMQSPQLSSSYAHSVHLVSRSDASARDIRASFAVASIGARFRDLLRRRTLLRQLGARLPRRTLSRRRGAARSTRRARRRSSTRPTAGSSPSSDSSGARSSSSIRSRRSSATRSSPPRTSASTSTPASIGSAFPARSSTTSARTAGARASRRSRCSSRATSFPSASRARRISFASSRKPRSRARSRRSTRRTRSSSSISIRSTSATAPTASRAPRERYFGKSVKDLNLAEAATLAALPKGPARYNPRRFPDRVIQRRNTIIELMRRDGKISDADASLAQAYPLRLARKIDAGEFAPYFVEWIRQLLDEQFGSQLYEQGLKVYTTLDLDLQSAAERALETQMRAIEAGQVRRLQAPSLRAVHGAGGRQRQRERGRELAVSAGRVRRDGSARPVPCARSIGGRDFDDTKFNRAVQALRQPGSTFKPIVYADAIQNGRPLSYILDDSPLSYTPPGGQTWAPQNYDSKFEGKMPMRRALYQSRNVADDPARHGARRSKRHRRGAQVRPHDSDPAVSVDSHRRRGRLPDRDGRRLLGVRHARHARDADGDHPRRESEGRRALGADAAAYRRAVAGRSVAHGRHDEGRRPARHRGGQRRRQSSIFRPAARPERPTTAPTSGSSATRRISSPASGWASTSRRRSRRTRRAACSPRRRGRRS